MRFSQLKSDPINCSSSEFAVCSPTHWFEKRSRFASLNLNYIVIVVTPSLSAFCTSADTSSASHLISQWVAPTQYLKPLKCTYTYMHPHISREWLGLNGLRFDFDLPFKEHAADLTIIRAALNRRVVRHKTQVTLRTAFVWLGHADTSGYFAPRREIGMCVFNVQAVAPTRTSHHLHRNPESIPHTKHTQTHQSHQRPQQDVVELRRR